MDAVTYPEESVQERLSDEALVCFKPRMDRQVELARHYGVTWTPGLLWLDAAGAAHHRNVGFFPPEEFLAESHLGQARVEAGSEDLDAAVERLDRLVQRWPASFAAPAALYWGGVYAKKGSGGIDGLKERWGRLLADYADTDWAMRVSFLGS